MNIRSRRRRHLFGMAAVLALPLAAAWGQTAADVSVSRLEVKGEIEGENARFTLRLEPEAARAGARLLLARGEIAHLDSTLPRGATLEREGDAFYVRFDRRGRQPVVFSFAARAAAQEDWRESVFTLAPAAIRRVEVRGDRPNVEIRLVGALDVERRAEADGRPVTTAFLAPERPCAIRWKPEVRPLTGELVVTCEANTIAVARVGALQLDTVLLYRIAQGTLQQLAIGLPEALHVTHVAGADIREWNIEDGADGGRTLRVVLSRPKDREYALRIEAEMTLPPFPGAFAMPALTPRDVLRTSGFLCIGTDSAIRLVVTRISGLTQMDPGALPKIEAADFTRRPLPQRSLYAYQYASLPFQMEWSADDIVTALHVEERLVLALEDNDLTLAATLDLDIRDAPARELILETDPAWNVTSVAGRLVADYDVRDEDGRRRVRVFLREAALGRAVIEARLERSMPEGAAGFDAPAFRVAGAKSERGYLVLRAEAGVRLEAAEARELREVHTGSLPVRVAGAQRAYRFRAGDWALAIRVHREEPSIYAETFHLASLGETGLYGSCTITYHIGGAPVRALRLRIPAECQNVEIVGRDVRHWAHEGEVWTVALQERVKDDYTLLVTYQQPVAYEGGGLRLGDIETLEVENESGYVALTGAASIHLDRETERAEALLPIAAEELPPEYALLIHNPVLRAWKYVGRPHATRVTVRRFARHALLEQVADHVNMSTRLSAEGEAVTEATYYVKNTLAQHLALRLPEGAALWAATVDGQSVRVLKSDPDRTLIPIERRRNPNEPMAVGLVYAERQAPLGAIARLRFRAPNASARGVFARWSFTAPERYRVWSAGRHSGAAATRPHVGLWALGRATLLRLLALVTGASRACGIGLGLAVVVWLWVFNAARGRPGHWLNWLAAAVAIVGTVAVASRGDLGRVRHDLWRSAVADPPSPRQWELTKPVMASGDALEARFLIMREPVAWALGGLRGLAALALAGLGWRALSRHDRRRTGAALGLTALAWGLSGFPAALDGLSAALVAAAPLAGFVGGIRGARSGGHRCRRVAPPAAPVEIPEPAPASPPAAEERFADRVPEPPPPPETGTSGGARLPALLAMAAASLLGAWAIRAEAPAPTLPPAVAQRAELTITAPPPEMGRPQTAFATLSAELDLERDRPVLLLPPSFVPAGFRGDRRLTIESTAEGQSLRASRAGRYSIELDYLTPVVEREGAWTLQAWLPPNLRHRVRLSLPPNDWRVEAPGAVYLKSEEGNTGLNAEMLFGTAQTVEIRWRPRERLTGAEEAKWIAEVNSLWLFQPGLVQAAHALHYQIAQGELQTLVLETGPEMIVTSVSGAGLSTWRFDAEARRLEAVLERPVTGAYDLQVVEQLPRDRLPYETAFTPPAVVGAAQQRGAVALAASDAVLIRVEAVEGLSGIHLGDFGLSPFEAIMNAAAASGAVEVKQAFRYPRRPASGRVRAERVTPEIRVVENSSVDISDERIVLASRLQLSIAKAAVFSVRLDLPEDFDIDTLTGEDVAHWDEVREEGRGVLVHFKRPALGERAVNLVISRMERGVEPAITVPRLVVRDAVKQTGTLALSGERGLRFVTVERDGVSEINPRDIGIPQPGYLAFRLLRPDWRVGLRTEVLEPVIRVETVQRFDVSEGLVSLQARLRLAIERTGIKILRLKSPRPGVALSVSGRNIARVQEVNAEEGIWEIELHNKVEGEYALEVSGQMPYDLAQGRAPLGGVEMLGAESQRDYIVVMSSGRLQVEALDPPADLRREDPRTIPAHFGAGDLSAAAVCYRATRPPWRFDLAARRHEAADLLAARVESVRLVTVASEDDHLVTQAHVTLQPGDLRFLEATLPEGAELWSVFVNDQPVAPLREKNACLIALSAGEDGRARVELIYSAAGRGGRFARGHAYEGPRFNLPLLDIQWEFYVPERYVYYGFGGTLRRRRDVGMEIVTFDAERYARLNDAIAQSQLHKARSVMEQGARFWREGRQQEARRALEQAVQYSQGELDLNEDARIQYRSLARQQAVVGLVNRRAALRRARNLGDEALDAQVRGFNMGNWQAEYGQRLEQNLEAKESENLNLVAEKMLEQQAAVEAELYPIRVTVPLQGRHLVFHREMEVRPGAEMRVVFRAGAGGLVRAAQTAAAALGFAALFGLLMAGFVGKR